MNVPKLRFKEFNDEWSLTNIRNISSLVTKGTTPRKYEDKGINFVKVENIHDNTISNISSYISEDTHNKELKRSILKENDILFSIAGALGRTAIVKNNNLPANTNQANAIIRIDNLDNIDLYYLLNRLNHSDITNYINKCQSVGAQPNLSLEQVNNINVSLPSKKEQIKIGKLLELLDRKIEIQSKKIEDLKLFTKKIETQYIFNDDNKYSQKRIDEIFYIKAGGDIKKGNVSKIKTTSFCYPIYSNNLEMNGLFGYSDIYKIEEDSITVTGRGDIGQAIKRNGKYYPIVRLLVLIPKINVNLIYMQEAINNLKLIQESTGVPQLTAPQISKYKILCPSIDIQNRYGKIIHLLQRKTEYEIRKIEKLNDLKKGLMQNMFV